MNLIEKSIIVNDQKLILTNERVVFWEKENALILSDLHVGKTAHFRNNGIAIPVDVLQQDLLRLSSIINHYSPKKIIIVGDLVHASRNSDLDYFRDFLKQFSTIKILLIKGNHDRVSTNFLKEIGVSEFHSFIEIDPFLFSHESLQSHQQFTISGHIHPGIKLKTSIHTYLKFPCYILTNSQLILPAFSLFTGLDTKNHPDNSVYYFFNEEGIYTF